MRLEADTSLIDAARTIGQIIREHNADTVSPVERRSSAIATTPIGSHRQLSSMAPNHPK
jgi:hypothetical protein